MEIYLQQDGARSGPYSLDQVRIWHRDGLLPVGSKAWFDGCADWIPVEEIPEIDEGSSVHVLDISTVPPFEAYQGEEPYVFASYAHKDAALIYPELSRLNDAGFNIWYDEGVDASSEWPEEIAKAVIGCAVFIVFVSPRATQSVNCRNEINLALNKSKPFLAIYLEETELPPGLELRMGDLQAILRYKLPADRYQKKTQDSLSHLLGKKPDRSRTRPPVGRQTEVVQEPEAVSAPLVEPSPAVQVDAGKASPKPRRKSLIVTLVSVFLVACGTLGVLFLGDDGKGEQEASDSSMVLIKDANLKAEILKTLGKTDGELTVDDLLSLKSLQIYPQVVHDLTGLGKAKNLEVLQFGCQAKDLSPLASLTNLKDLHLAGTEISSLKVFSNLENLEKLSFRGGATKDLSPLEGLPNLKVLKLDGFEIAEFGPFSKLHSLEELHHNNSKVSSISDVRNLTNLRFLAFQSVAACDLSPVGFLKNLETLHVKGARKNLGVLSKLPKIQRISISTSDFSDSSPLRELAGLDLQNVELLLHNCGITDFSPLHELKIGSLQISHNPISTEQESMLHKSLPDCRIAIDRSSVSSSEEVRFKDANLIAAIRKALNKPEGEILEDDLLALNKLSIWEAPVSALSGLEKAANLEILSFHSGYGRGVKDFSPLAQLPEFKELYFDGASVSDLKAFSELKNLEVLSLQNTEVSDISSVRGLPNLKRLDIMPTAVCDLNPLLSLQNLEYLNITGSPNDLEVFSKLSKLNRLYLHRCGLVDIAPLAKLDQSLVRTLSLTNNQISDFRPLHKLKLESLHIDENPISEEQKAMLRKALPNTAIRHAGVYWAKEATK